MALTACRASHLRIWLLLLLAFVAPLATAKLPRSIAEAAAFKRSMPCPANGLHRGPCPGHQVDHIIALCAGGPDKSNNMQWLAVETHRNKTRLDIKVCRAIKQGPDF